MENYSLLRRAGKSKKPILLKRSDSATYGEWLQAACYILETGNPNVILCERGIKTFVKEVRSTLDLSAVPYMLRESHLPIVVDASHASGPGNRDLVIPLLEAAVVAGAHGVLVEVHNDPANAKCDGPQSLYPDQFDDLVRRLNIYWKIRKQLEAERAESKKFAA